MNTHEKQARGVNSTKQFLMGLVLAVAMMVPNWILAAVPAVENDAASSVLLNSAVLNGTLTLDGAQVYVYWGETDGGTTFGNWGKTNDLGVKVVGSWNLTAINLLPNHTYYYRFYATNVDGDAWASTTTNFQTLAAAVQAPINLGSCSNFTILAATAISTTGGGIINGDVGLSPAGSQGIPPAQIIGEIHNGDLIAAQAQLDLTDAYNETALRSVDRITLTDGQNIGGETLAPGLYWSATSLQITGDLTLDAGGDVNAVWIFQMGSTLTTAAGVHPADPLIPNSRVILAGGARAKNIFWQVGSSATLGTYSVFKGTIMAQASVSMDTACVTDGRALARTGAVTFNGTSGSLPQEIFGPLSIQINAPTNVATYTSLTNLQNMGGTSSDSIGVTLITLRNSRDVALFNCTGTDNWMLNGFQLFQGENFLDAIAYNTLGNCVTGLLQITYGGDAQYDDVLRSGNIVQELTFPDPLTPGTTVPVQWKILSYVPVISRVYSGVAGGWTNFQNGTYQGVSNSMWNLNGRHANVYSFDCAWRVPQQATAGVFNVWFNVAQMDGDQFMIAVIPDGVGTRHDPTYTKLIQRTIATDGDGSISLNDPDTWDSARIFETVLQHKERSAVTITDITMLDNLKQGTQVTCQWKVQSYIAVNAQMLVLNVATNNIWLTNTATQVGSPVATTFSFTDRTTGLQYFAKEYTFLSTFTIPIDAAELGKHQIYFRSQDSANPASSWMSENLAADVDAQPVLKNGMYGRLIERTFIP